VNFIQRFIEKWKGDQRKRICSEVLTGFDHEKIENWRHRFIGNSIRS
jgi:hypothetical protein